MQDEAVGNASEAWRVAFHVPSGIMAQGVPSRDPQLMVERHVDLRTSSSLQLGDDASDNAPFFSWRKEAASRVT